MTGTNPAARQGIWAGFQPWGCRGGINTYLEPWGAGGSAGRPGPAVPSRSARLGPPQQRRSRGSDVCIYLRILALFWPEVGFLKLCACLGITECGGGLKVSFPVDWQGKAGISIGWQRSCADISTNPPPAGGPAPATENLHLLF